MADVDYGFLLRAKNAGYRFGCVDDDLVMYRNHPGQISRADYGLQQKLANEKRQRVRQQMAGSDAGLSNYERNQLKKARRKR